MNPLNYFYNNIEPLPLNFWKTSPRQCSPVCFDEFDSIKQSLFTVDAINPKSSCHALMLNQDGRFARKESTEINPEIKFVKSTKIILVCLILKCQVFPITPTNN